MSRSRVQCVVLRCGARSNCACAPFAPSWDIFSRISQIDYLYACLDAYASVLLYKEIGKFKDPIFSDAPSQVPLAGTEVTTTVAMSMPCVRFLKPKPFVG